MSVVSNSGTIAAMNKFFITNAIPYVNAKPHIGHALEFIQSDVIRRFHLLQNQETKLLCGGDENAIKNVQAAEQAGIPIQKFIDDNTNFFADLSKKLNVQFDFWQKGSAPKHYIASQKLWELCNKNGDIYQKKYSGLYCVGCELFYEKEELDEKGECYEHPGKKLEEVTEENYFFKLGKYQERLLKILQGKDDNFKIDIVPEKRKHEVLSFLERGLQDISISRSNARAKNWGVPVPNDDSQRMYVWFDALNIYQSGIGFGWDDELYKKWWPADLHVIGKGIIRFHAIYWPAFLLSAGLDLPKKIFVHEYFTVNGQKMSKTIGNVYNPLPLVEKCGADPLRYYCLGKISPFNDGDFSEEKFYQSYNSDLANGLGNLVARTAKLLEINNVCCGLDETNSFHENIILWLLNFQFDLALKDIWERIKGLDKLINDKKPWEKDGMHNQVLWNKLIQGIRQIAYDLQPFLPETAKKIQEQFKGDKIISQPVLFPRI